MSASERHPSVPRATAPLGDEALRRAVEKALSGDATARETVVQSHLRLVWDVVRRFRHRGEDPDDLFQLGCLGLVKALERYDPAYGTKFTTYAVPLVIGEIKRHLRDDASIRVGRRLRDIAYQARQIQDEATKATGRCPPIREVAEKMGVDPAEVIESLEASRPPLSLFREAGEDGEGALLLMDQLTAAGAVASAALGKAVSGDPEETGRLEGLALREALSRLDERDVALVRMRFFEDKTQAEVGEILGVSQVQVSRLERKALLRLRELLAPG